MKFLVALLVSCLLIFCWGCTKDGEKIVFDSSVDAASDVVVEAAVPDTVPDMITDDDQKVDAIPDGVEDTLPEE